MAKSRFVVQTASANMPNSCWGQYIRVAVLEIDPRTCPDDGPKMISARARGVVRVVETWEKCNVGRTDRCAANKAIKAAEEMAAELNRKVAA